MADQRSDRDHQTRELAIRHLRLGWWAMLVFLSFGGVLELMHAFKVGWYLDVDHEARRLLWRLSHAHGTLLGVVNILFGLSVKVFDPPESWVRASPFLVAATVLLPGSFFLGGFFVHGGDPGLGVLLAPLGGALLFVGVGLIVAGLEKRKGTGPAVDQDA